jgi:hypothetical protein
MGSTSRVYEAANRFCNMVIEVDAILLTNAHHEWERPYLTKQYRPILELVLCWHRCSERYWADYFEDEEPVRLRSRLILSKQSLDSRACWLSSERRGEKLTRDDSHYRCKEHLDQEQSGDPHTEEARPYSSQRGGGIALNISIR